MFVVVVVVVVVVLVFAVVVVVVVSVVVVGFVVQALCCLSVVLFSVQTCLACPVLLVHLCKFRAGPNPRSKNETVRRAFLYWKYAGHNRSQTPF